MSRIDQLPPDQRAALALLLRRRKSYSEVASIFGVEPRALHDRAHAALAVLSPALARNLTPALRERVGEYLLGQQETSEAEATRAQLASSPPAREWARALTLELMHLAAEPLPEVPAPAAAPPGEVAPTIPAAAAPRSAPGAGADGQGARPAISRRGGAALLAAIALIALVAVVALIATSGGGGGESPASQAASTHGGGGPHSSAAHRVSKLHTGHSAKSKSGSGGGSSSSSSSSEPQPKIENQINLSATSLGGSAMGTVIVAGLEGKHAIILRAEHLQPPGSSFTYFLWLLDSEGGVKPHPVEVSKVTSNGTVQGATVLPADASSYNEIELTRETAKRPSSPSTEVVLEGKFSLG